MLNVGIRELKDHLSNYMKKVKNGEIITITERGRAIASITPMEDDITRTRLMELCREGIISWYGGDKPKGLKNSPKIKGKTLAEIVIEDRR